ncbi:hypothetical protein [Nakamurella antarctica]|uniref:hypothetical protein n=1 Tax=Nakamurella antarctica TaxID=1902245 RepID=UPI001EF106E8|nr:hypothetical protein [Nakamurella antarctica]
MAVVQQLNVGGVMPQGADDRAAVGLRVRTENAVGVVSFTANQLLVVVGAGPRRSGRCGNVGAARCRRSRGGNFGARRDIRWGATAAAAAAAAAVGLAGWRSLFSRLMHFLRL